MKIEHSGGGLDELLRLSRQFEKQKNEATQREKQAAMQRKKSQGVISELRSFSISMAVKQLQLVANPQMVKQVNALKSKPGTAELRKLIEGLVRELEKQVSTAAFTNKDIKPIEKSIRTLSILLGLFFSLNS